MRLPYKEPPVHQEEFQKLLKKYTAGMASERERVKVDYFFQKLQQYNEASPIPLKASQKRTIISVKTGNVRVKSNTEMGTGAVLTKDQQIVFEKGLPSTITQVSSATFTAWTRNEILPDHKSLSETAQILENRYDVTIDFNDPFIKKRTLTGKFKNEKLKNVLASIALLKDLKIEYLTAKHILIRKNTP